MRRYKRYMALTRKPIKRRRIDNSIKFDNKNKLPFIGETSELSNKDHIIKNSVDKYAIVRTRIDIKTKDNTRIDDYKCIPDESTILLSFHRKNGYHISNTPIDPGQTENIQPSIIKQNLNVLPCVKIMYIIRNNKNKVVDSNCVTINSNSNHVYINKSFQITCNDSPYIVNLVSDIIPVSMDRELYKVQFSLKAV